MFAAPFAPFMHGIEDRSAAKTRERKFARGFDLMDDRALVNKTQVKIKNVVADEKIAVDSELPKFLDYLCLITLEHLHFGADRRLDGITEA